MADILLAPSLGTRQIVSKNEQTTLQFSCYSSTVYCLELWTNLSRDKSWLGIPFIRQENDYQLNIDLSYLSSGEYEYTLRFTLDKYKNDWCWYGTSNDNGKICITPFADTISDLPISGAANGLNLILKQSIDNNISLTHYKIYAGAPLYFSVGKIACPIYSFVALIRKGSCWMTPVAGNDSFEGRNRDEKWQMLLFVDSVYGHVHLWMVVSQDSDCWFSPESSNSLGLHRSDHKNDNVHLFMLSTRFKQDFTLLIPKALEYYHQFVYQDLLSFNNRQLQTIPNLSDKLGYCTWNAFGKEISLENIRSAMKSLSDNNIPVSYLLLDDGWQHVSNDQSQLKGFEANQDKFPKGLEQSISELKTSYPFLQYIGVWHTLWGYWNGIDETFAKTNGYAGFPCDNKNQHQSIGIINNSKHFYDDFYHFLSKAGVDFVKVDNQGGFQDLKLDQSHKISLWDTYRQNMLESADTYLSGQVVHCMSLTPHVLFHPLLLPKQHRSKPIFRNSDDFFPDEQSSHPWHIYANAINTLWTSQYPVMGDWDMFQSIHPFAEYHASSRAISGGPVYITDIPAKHDVGLIYKLLGETRYSGWCLLRSDKAPLPTFDTVFGNPLENQSLVIIHNFQKLTCSDQDSVEEYGIFGFWNSSDSKEKLAVITTNTIPSKKLAALSLAYTISGPDQGKLMLLSNKDTCSFAGSMTARVCKMGSTLVCISQVKTMGLLLAACLGLIDKFNSVKAIKRTTIYKSADKETVFEVQLSHRSKCFGYWIKPLTEKVKIKLTKVCLDGIILKSNRDWNWCLKSNLLKVNMMAVPLEKVKGDTFDLKVHIQEEEI
ncbi:hypothetical protein CU098_013424 [Rhizopus stolonifer]|uniref:Uncharacterized protein n=1 Tax=Rhizopus stolonifer TaxID=4846 RepID=A0A367KW13_RHIST|nr:hypothetical protein CU098_013424 [Rhizopus stolonifer]